METIYKNYFLKFIAKIYNEETRRMKLDSGISISLPPLSFFLSCLVIGGETGMGEGKWWEKDNIAKTGYSHLSLSPYHTQSPSEC